MTSRSLSAAWKSFWQSDLALLALLAPWTLLLLFGGVAFLVSAHPGAETSANHEPAAPWDGTWMPWLLMAFALHGGLLLGLSIRAAFLARRLQSFSAAVANLVVRSRPSAGTLQSPRAGTREDAGAPERLSARLQVTSTLLRSTAAENTHALATPVATIKAALAMARRSLPEENARARRAAEIIDQAADSLILLIRDAQRRLHVIADVVGCAHEPVDLLAALADQAQRLPHHPEIRLEQLGPRRPVVLTPRSVLSCLLDEFLHTAVRISGSTAGLEVTVAVVCESVQVSVAGGAANHPVGTTGDVPAAPDDPARRLEFLASALGGKAEILLTQDGHPYRATLTLPMT